MNVVITGATGYIGRNLIKQAISFKHNVIAASRRPAEGFSAWILFDLTSDIQIILPPKTNVLIHLAADTTSIGPQNDSELHAAKLLIAASQEVGAKFIFVSSQASRENAPSSYGRTKWLIEQHVLASNGIVVRPGLVYGGSEEGLFGAISKLVRQLPILPAFIPSPKVQPIHIDDLTKALIHIATTETHQQILYVASANPISFTRFLLTIASVRARKPRLTVPIPIILIKIMSPLLGKRLGAHLNMNQLNSLFNLPLMDTRHTLTILNLSLRQLSSGMHRSGNNNRRILFKEGSAILYYVLGFKPSASVLRRYVRVIEQLKMGRSMDLPSWILNYPKTLALLDEGSFLQSEKGAELGWRLRVATALSEASIQGARRILKWDTRTNRIKRTLYLLQIILSEITWRLLRLLCSPLLCFLKSKKI